MEIEAGKTYETKGGQKVHDLEYIESWGPTPISQRPAHWSGLIYESERHSAIARWLPNGRGIDFYSYKEKKSTDDDLVEVGKSHNI